MPASTFISRFFFIFSVSLLLYLPVKLYAEDTYGSSKNSKTLIPEEEDFSTTPFTEYGDFNEEAEENEDTRFFQHGRFFGLSLGSGFEGVTGNRGLLWQGGFPMIDLRMHYWFDFNLAFDFGYFYVPHFYEFSRAGSNDHVDVNVSFIGFAIKYYFDTKNLSAALTFANPYISMGGGIAYKTENSRLLGIASSDNTLGLDIGAGLEFPIKPKKIFFAIEGKFFSAVYADNASTDFTKSPGIPDLKGSFYTVTGNFLFTW